MKLNILILATSKPNKYLIDAIKAKGHTYECLDPSFFYLTVSDDPNSFERGSIYDGHKKHKTPVKLNVSKFNAIITRIGKNLDYNVNVVAHLTEICGIYSPQTAGGLIKAKNKWLTHQILSAKGIRTIKTIFAKAPLHHNFLIDEVGGVPLVMKKTSGSQGKQVIKCNDREQTSDTITAFWSSEEELILQKYVNASGKDYRAIVIGDSVVSVMERTSNDGWKANVSLGGEGKKAELTKEEQLLCVNASKAIGLEFSGVDLIKDENGKAYITEINSNMGSKIIDITGYNHFNDLIKFIEKAGFLSGLPEGHPDKLRAEKMTALNYQSKSIFALSDNKKIIQ